jgi:hypothetical protein
LLLRVRCDIYFWVNGSVFAGFWDCDGFGRRDLEGERGFSAIRFRPGGFSRVIVSAVIGGIQGLLSLGCDFRCI